MSISIKTRRVSRALSKGKYSRYWRNLAKKEMFDEPATTNANPEHCEAPRPVQETFLPEARAKKMDAYALRAIGIAVAGWILPGFGHALLKMWGRAAAIFLSVGFLVYLGAGMRGNLFSAGGRRAIAHTLLHAKSGGG